MMEPDLNIVFWGKTSICSCQYFQQLDMVTSIFLNIFVQDCSFCPRLVQNVPEFRYEILKSQFLFNSFCLLFDDRILKKELEKLFSKILLKKTGPWNSGG